MVVFVQDVLWPAIGNAYFVYNYWQCPMQEFVELN